MLTVIQIQLLSRNITSSFKTWCFSGLDLHTVKIKREVTAEIKVVLFHRNDMTCDARRNRRWGSVIIFEIMIIFLTEIEVKSLVNYVVQTGWPPY